MSTNLRYAWVVRYTAGDEERLDAWVALLHAQHAVTESVEADVEAAAGIPLAWHEVLSHLSREPNGAARMQELAKAALLTKSGLTRLIDRMEQAGVVRRTACDADRRGTYAVLTARGRRALERSHAAFLESIHEHFSRHLSDRDVRDLVRVLGGLLEANSADAPGRRRVTAPAG